MINFPVAVHGDSTINAVSN